MAVLEVLPEVVGPPKLLGDVALAELVHLLQVLRPGFPVLVCNLPSTVGRETREASGPGKIPAAVAAAVGLAGTGGAVVEGVLEGEHGAARPAVAAEVERVLVALGFVLVLEAVGAELALVLFFGFVGAKMNLVNTLKLL